MGSLALGTLANACFVAGLHINDDGEKQTSTYCKGGQYLPMSKKWRGWLSLTSEV